MIPLAQGTQQAFAPAAGNYAKKQGGLSALDATKTVANYVPVVGPILGGLIDLFSPDPEPVKPPPPPKEKFQLVQPTRTEVPLAPRPNLDAQMVQSQSPERLAAFANMMASRRTG